MGSNCNLPASTWFLFTKVSGARISFPVWKKESHQFGHFSNFQQPHTISSDDRESNFLVKETRLSLSASVDFSLSLARTRSCGHPPLCPAKGRIYLWTSVPRGISIFRKENQKKRCWSVSRSDAGWTPRSQHSEYVMKSGAHTQTDRPCNLECVSSGKKLFTKLSCIWYV